MFQRNAYQSLQQWKDSTRRKPLLLQGARQVGKTHLIQSFGEKEYEHVIYLNFEENALLASFFETNLDPESILEKLRTYFAHPISSDDTLIIFDEIQACDQALNSLKYFCEKANHYHIIGAGSLLGVKLSGRHSFPVGKVNFLDIYPLNFFEFLDVMGKSSLRKMLEKLPKVEPLAELFHQELIEWLKKYYLVGGMPEAVFRYAQEHHLLEVQEIHQEILNAYEQDFSKHAPLSDVPKISLIWESLPSQLARENKKFLFSALKESARGREYESALQWLKDAGLVHVCQNVQAPKLPLKHYEDKSFKLYLLDIGLLSTMSSLDPRVVLEGNSLFHEFHGALVENYMAQQLVSQKQSLYYWAPSKQQAEMDFLVSSGMEVLPLEVKAGVNPKSKSLKSYQKQFDPALSLRSNLLNLKAQDGLVNIPLYLAPKGIEWFFDSESQEHGRVE